MALAVFITWLIGAFIVFISLFRVLIESDEEITGRMLLSIFWISLFSWLVILMYFIIIIMLKFEKNE